MAEFYLKTQQIDSILSSQNITEQTKEKLISLLSDNSDIQRYFFKKVTDLNWFELLKTNLYFNPARIIFDSNNNATFWIVLDYFEHISEQVKENPQYGKELIDIIENVVKFSNNKKRINNYHIWWYCVKILNNLPADIIKDNLKIEKFKQWLSVWTSHSDDPTLAISELGEKLLPKFLGDEYVPEYKYSETILDVITEIRLGGKKGVLGERNDVVLAWDPYWIKESFRKNSEIIGKKCSIESILNVSNKLRVVLEYNRPWQSGIIKIDSNIYQIKVSRYLPNGSGRYSCSVMQYSKEQLKDEDLDNKSLFWMLYDTAPAMILKEFDFSAPVREKMVLEIKKNLPEDINWELYLKLDEKLGNIFDGLHSDASAIWYKSLGGVEDKHSREAGKILILILRDILLSKCEADREGATKILDIFLSKEYPFPIYKRFVLLCIDKFWTDYSGYFEAFFGKVPDAFEESEYEVELYDILHNHNEEFSQALIDRIKTCIEQVPDYYVRKKLSAYWQYKRLSPLRENPEFSEWYESVKKEYRPKDDKEYEPERESIKMGRVDHNAPVSKEWFLETPIAELIKYLKEFKGADSEYESFTGKPDKQGLAGVLLDAVKENPKKFTDEIEAFNETEYVYKNALLSGLRTAWNDNQEIDWIKIYQFICQYLDRDKEIIVKEAILGQGEDGGDGKYIRMVDTIVELISDACRDDKRALAPSLFSNTEEIFDLIFPVLKGEKHPDTQRDAFTYVLNTTLGRTIMSYLTFILRKARITNKKEVGWGKNKYERFFPIGVDASILFGYYLPQMKYLDEAYTLEKIEYFTRKEADSDWQMFMEGYIRGSQVYPGLYSLMRKNYYRALEKHLFKGDIEQQLAGHICLGYLHFNEELQAKNKDGEESLFWKMLMDKTAPGKLERWQKVPDFFWARAESIDKTEDPEKRKVLKNRVLEFWAWTVANKEIVREYLGTDYNIFLGRLLQLTVYLDKIDEEKEKWLLLSAPHVDMHSGMFFIDYLAQFNDSKSLERIGRIFLKLIETTTSIFKHEEIYKLVEKIYQKGKKEDADEICNMYGSYGYDFLHPLWKVNNPHISAESNGNWKAD